MHRRNTLRYTRHAQSVSALKYTHGTYRWNILRHTHGTYRRSGLACMQIPF